MVCRRPRGSRTVAGDHLLREQGRGQLRRRGAHPRAVPLRRPRAAGGTQRGQDTTAQPGRRRPVGADQAVHRANVVCDRFFLDCGVLDRVHLCRCQLELVYGEVIGHVSGVGCPGQSDHSELERKAQNHLRRSALVAAGEVVNE
jgi:hypothetical protein